MGASTPPTPSKLERALNNLALTNHNPLRERSERRKLQRQVRKEQRGAARELRKDGAFMAAVRDKEKATKQAALDKSAKRVRCWG